MSAGPFVDTDVLLYLVSADEAKAARAEQLLAGRIVISVQVLDEFANVARRKQRLQWSAIDAVLAGVRHFSDVRALTVEDHERAIALASRHQLSVYDALIVASALHADCELLWSEDLRHGQRFGGRLTVRNPFCSHSRRRAHRAARVP